MEWNETEKAHVKPGSLIRVKDSQNCPDGDYTVTGTSIGFVFISVVDAHIKSIPWSKCSSIEPIIKSSNTIAGLKWLGGRFAYKAKEARQAEKSARSLDTAIYPHSVRLADTYARIAEIYENEATIVEKELA